MLPASPTSNNPDQNRLDMANSYKSTAQKEQSPPILPVDLLLDLGEFAGNMGGVAILESTRTLSVRGLA